MKYIRYHVYFAFFIEGLILVISCLLLFLGYPIILGQRFYRRFNLDFGIFDIKLINPEKLMHIFVSKFILYNFLLGIYLKLSV